VGLSTVRTARRLAAVLALTVLALTVLAGCGSDDQPATPQPVRVSAGDQTVDIKPSQYCLDGDGQRYDVTPPVIEVPAGTPITLTVPGPVADRGWGVQVFDDKLHEKIGEVAVDAGTTTFDGINSSDVVPAAFYLVIVEDKGGKCGLFSGAWPVGFVRPGGDIATGSATPAPAG
jgi:Protein of unknown function (DUF2771)